LNLAERQAGLTFVTLLFPSPFGREQVPLAPQIKEIKMNQFCKM
jgi:hypothetical protein